eukprot:GGOE01020449.1.p1 GENE.GGOE01020449.1~~GGOE01020449.1.p1  ORF type:complete len:812 (+),score=171.44 GGOE01020449.1:49-2484(+)
MSLSGEFFSPMSSAPLETATNQLGTSASRMSSATPSGQPSADRVANAQDKLLSTSNETLQFQPSLPAFPTTLIPEHFGLPQTDVHLDLAAQQQYVLALQNYIGAIPLKMDIADNRSHRRRFGEAGGRYRGREYADLLGFTDPLVPSFMSRPPLMPSLDFIEGLKKDGNLAAMAGLLGLPPHSTDQSLPSMVSRSTDAVLPQNEATSSNSQPSPTATNAMDAAGGSFRLPETLQTATQPAMQHQADGAPTASLVPLPFNPTQYHPGAAMDFLVPSYLPSWDISDILDGPAFIERLVEQTDAEALLLSEQLAQIPPEQTEAYHLVKSTRLFPEEGYDMESMRPYNPQMNFLNLVAKEIQYTEKHTQSVKLSQRRKGTLRFMSKPDYRPDYPGLLDDCSIYALDLRNRSIIADFKRCGDNEVQYSFGKPMTKKVHQLMEFNGLRYTEYYSTCQGVLVCPHAGENTLNEKPCTLLKATSSRCRTCAGHGCALKHLKCDVRLIKYVLEPAQTAGSICADPREKFLLVSVGQHRHPLPPPTNLPFKLFWAIEAYLEQNDKITAAELWPKIRYLHPTLGNKDTVREIVRQVRSKRNLSAKEKATTGSSPPPPWAFKGLYDPNMVAMACAPPLMGIPLPFYQQQALARQPLSFLPQDDASADLHARLMAAGASPFFSTLKMPSVPASQFASYPGMNFGGQDFAGPDTTTPHPLPAGFPLFSLNANPMAMPLPQPFTLGNMEWSQQEAQPFTSLNHPVEWPAPPGMAPSGPMWTSVQTNTGGAGDEQSTVSNQRDHEGLGPSVKRQKLEEGPVEAAGEFI